MDGGRRLLRSIKEAASALAPAQLALAGASANGAPSARPAPARSAARTRAPRLTRADRFLRIFGARGTGLALTMALLGGALGFGAVRGGQFDAFVAANGSIGDIVARVAGFDLDSITITGARDLYESEIVQAAGISDRNSLLFLNVGDIRDRLKQVPLVRDANVRKLYPDRLLIEVIEREPHAVWQKDGALVVISADGTAIEELRDDRFGELPFVVGVGANKRVAEFQKIVEAASEARSRVRAGVLVGERRWNIKMTNGLEVRLPERQPEAAFAQFMKIARDAKLLDKDLVSIDLRVPGRMFVRLTEEAAATRAENLARKKGRPGQT